MDDASLPRTDPAGEIASEPTIAAIARNALKDLASANEAAASLLIQRAEAGAFSRHMTDGDLRDLADELIGTCSEAEDED